MKSKLMMLCIALSSTLAVVANGRVRFRSVGYSGSGDQLVDEISIMIDALKQGGDKKGF